MTALTERDWQSRITDLAKLRGWRWYHTHDSRRSNSGFPDLVLIRRGRLVFAELKTETGRLSIHQKSWLADLSAVPGIQVFLWRPSDWTEVQRVLT